MYELCDTAAQLDAQLAQIRELLLSEGHSADDLNRAVAKLDEWLQFAPLRNAQLYPGQPDVWIQSYPATADDFANHLCVIFQISELEHRVQRMQYRLLR